MMSQSAWKAVGNGDLFYLPYLRALKIPAESTGTCFPVPPPPLKSVPWSSDGWRAGSIGGGWILLYRPHAEGPVRYFFLKFEGEAAVQPEIRWLARLLFSDPFAGGTLAREAHWQKLREGSKNREKQDRERLFKIGIESYHALRVGLRRERKNLRRFRAIEARGDGEGLFSLLIFRVILNLIAILKWRCHHGLEPIPSPTWRKFHRWVARPIPPLALLDNTRGLDWLKHFSLRPNLFQKIFRRLGRFFAHANPSAISIGNLHERWLSWCPQTSPSADGKKSRGGHRRESGSYYTPEEIVEKMVSMVSLNTDIGETRFFDPACGCGDFLAAATRVLPAGYLPRHIQKLTTHRRKLLHETVFGCDINPVSVEWCRFVLWEIGGFRPSLIAALRKNILVGNGLLCLTSRESHRLRGIVAAPLSQYFQIASEVVGSQTTAKGTEFPRQWHQWQNLYRPLDGREIFPALFSSGKTRIAILGNPPYGAKLTPADRKYFGRLYPHARTCGNTAGYFIERWASEIEDGGELAFVIPKSYGFSADWEELRVNNLAKTRAFLDLGQSFPGVNLEQGILHLSSRPAPHREGQEWREAVETLFARGIKSLPGHLTPIEWSIARRVLDHGTGPLGDRVRTRRGFPLQRSCQSEGTLPVIGGRDIREFWLRDSGRFIADPPAGAVCHPPLIAFQNIVTCARSPSPHLRLRGAPITHPIVALDTVNLVESRFPELSPVVLAAYLQSNLVNFFLHAVLYCKGGLTLHFDGYFLKRIPALSGKNFASLAVTAEVVARNPSDPGAWDRWNLEIYRHFGLSTEEMAFLDNLLENRAKVFRRHADGKKKDHPRRFTEFGKKGYNPPVE